MPVFPSEEWFRALEAITNNNPEYEKAGADWEGDLITAIEAEPRKLDKPFYWYSKPHHGKLLESYQIQNSNEKKAAFVISGQYSTWKAIIKRESDAMQMMLKGKIRVKGDMQKLLRYTKFQQLGMKALSMVETKFADEVQHS